MHFQTKISQITMYFQSKNTKNDAFQSTICLIQYRAYIRSFDFYYGVMSYILCVIEPSSFYIDLVLFL